MQSKGRDLYPHCSLAGLVIEYQIGKWFSWMLIQITEKYMYYILTRQLLRKNYFLQKVKLDLAPRTHFYVASSNLIEFELDGGKMIKCGIADAEFCQGSILSLLLTADFVSIQQKLSSLFTMESDCPERIGQMEHFPSLTTKQE